MDPVLRRTEYFCSDADGKQEAHTHPSPAQESSLSRHSHMATWVNNKLVLRPLSCSPLFWSYGYAVANALHDYIYIRGNETSDRDRTITTKSTTTTTVGFVLSNYWKYAVTGEIFCYVS